MKQHFFQVVTAVSSELDLLIFFRIAGISFSAFRVYRNIYLCFMKISLSCQFLVHNNRPMGIVGTKFDNNSAGRFDLQTCHLHDQIVVNKHIAIGEYSYYQLSGSLV